jgi:hypothetical protein
MQQQKQQAEEQPQQQGDEQQEEQQAHSLYQQLPQPQSISSWIPQSQFLPRSLSRSYNILSVPTDAYMQLFQDAQGHPLIVVGITQLQIKIGTWLWCQWEPDELDLNISNSNNKNNNNGKNYQYSLVLGGRGRNEKDEALFGLYGRLMLEQIMAQMSQPTTTKLLLGISLQPQHDEQEQPSLNHDTTAMLHAIVSAMAQLYSDLLRSAT